MRNFFPNFLYPSKITSVSLWLVVNLEPVCLNYPINSSPNCNPPLKLLRIFLSYPPSVDLQCHLGQKIANRLKPNIVVIPFSNFSL